MSIGLRIGPVVGPRVGPAVGVSADELASPSSGTSVTRDATLGIYIPQTSAEFSAFCSAHSLVVPVANSLWTCQEASGNILDKIGSLNLTAASVSYRQTVTGAATKAISWADSSTTGASGPGAHVASGTGPSPASTSVAWLGIVRVTSAGGNRGLVCGGGAAGTTETLTRVQTTGVPQNKCLGTTVNGATDIRNTWVPVLHVYDRTNTKARTFLLAEQINGTYGAGTADGQKGFGATSVVGSSATAMIWACMWSGANAEQTDANWKAFLTAMGFTLGY